MSAQPLARDVLAAGVESMALLEEITHRVMDEYSSALASLDIAAQRSADRAARATLASMAVRLRCYADAHRALRPPEKAGFIDLGEYLEPLCAALTRAWLEQRGVRLALTATPVLLDADRCWRVGRVVSELIENAARDALLTPGGTILIELSQQGEDVLCCISENGGSVRSGPPDREGPLIKALAVELGGFVSWRHTPGGRAAYLVLPRDPPAADRRHSRGGADIRR